MESVKSDLKNVTAGDSILQLLKSAITDEESAHNKLTQTSSNAPPRISVIASPQKMSISSPSKKW